jgi:rod shape-determining protein MreC
VSIELAPKDKEWKALYILAPLLLLHLTLISLQVEDPQGTLLFRRAVLTLSTPAFRVVSGVNSAVRETWTGWVWLRGAREENRTLHESVRQLKLREHMLEEARLENERLRRLLGYRERLAHPSIAARVVGRSPDYLSNVAFVDRGASDGVQADSPVVTEAGVIGRVILVFPESSQVQLITNPDAAVGATVTRTQSLGVVKGTGNPILELHYVGATEQIEVGDTLVTSGLDGVFPSGIPVGTVVSSRRGKSVFREIEIQPSADPLRSRDMLILPPAASRRP